MNSKKDIKVTFLNKANSKDSEKIRIFFKDIFNNDVQIDLRPGEIVYSQINYLTNSLKIYSRKGIISIEEEEKPSFLNYYVGYKEEEIENNWFLFNLKKSLEIPYEPLAEPLVEVIEEKTILKDVILEDILPEEIKFTEEENAIIEEMFDEGIITEETISQDDDMLEDSDILDDKESKPKPKSRGKKGPGRPKKRGPKKGAAKRKKLEE